MTAIEMVHKLHRAEEKLVWLGRVANLASYKQAELAEALKELRDVQEALKEGTERRSHN